MKGRTLDHRENWSLRLSVMYLIDVESTIDSRVFRCTSEHLIIRKRSSMSLGVFIGILLSASISFTE